MDRDSVDWKGYWIAAPTPFTEVGTLNERALRSVLRLYYDQGIHGVLVNGTTGEWFSQTETERQRVAEIAVEELGGKIPVVIGCTTFTPSQTIALGLHAREIGADGMLSTPPPYAAPTPREIIAFFSAISDSVDLPIMVYNWARGVGVEITWEKAIELAESRGVVAIKDSTVNRIQAFKTLEKVGDRVRIFGGFIDRLGLSVLRDLGGDGNVDGGGLGAESAVAFYEAFWRNDFMAAQSAASRYVALMTRLIRPDWSGTFGSPQAQIKACMNMLGQSGGHVRPPLLPIDDPGQLEMLRQILDEAGLFADEARPALALE